MFSQTRDDFAPTAVTTVITHVYAKSDSVALRLDGPKGGQLPPFQMLRQIAYEGSSEIPHDFDRDPRCERRQFLTENCAFRKRPDVLVDRARLGVVSSLIRLLASLRAPNSEACVPRSNFILPQNNARLKSLGSMPFHVPSQHFPGDIFARSGFLGPYDSLLPQSQTG